MTTNELLFKSLRFEAERRDFGLRSPRERKIARHFYLLALEEAERAISEDQTTVSPRDAA